MSVEKGRMQYLGIKRETTRLTAETSGFYFLPWTSLSAKNENTYREDNSAFGARGALLNRTLVSQHGVVNFGGFCDSDNLIFPLYFIFGDVIGETVSGATTWTGHVLTSIEGPTATVVYKVASEGHKRVRGWMPTKIDFDFSVEEATYSIEGVGILEEQGTTLTPATAVPGKYLLGRHVAIKYASTLSGLSNGTLLSNVKNLKISFETGVDIDKHKVLGSLNPSNNTSDGFSATVEFDILHRSTQAAYFQSLHNGGETQALQVKIEANNLPPIGTSNLKPQLIFEFPESIIEVERTIELDDLLMQKCKVVVHRPHLCNFVLVNSISAI